MVVSDNFIEFITNSEKKGIDDAISMKELLHD